MSPILFSVGSTTKDTGEEFRSFGKDEIEKLVDLFEPMLTKEEHENALNQWLDYNDKDCIKYILPLVNIMLTISPSTAECERGFSTMNRVKTQGRTSMNQSLLQNLY